MRHADFLRLLVLAAIWGASFLFMRIVAPVLGALWTAEVRVALAGVAMLLFMAATGRAMHFGTNWKQYLVLGTLNSALPFALFSYAALTLPAGYSAIVNATTPLWGALIGAAVLGEKLTARKIAGLIIGIVGVAFLVRLGPARFSQEVLIAALACIGAAMCYGIAGVYSKKTSISIAPPQMATGSQLGAALVLLPFLPLSPIRGDITLYIALVACALALLCSAVAYFIYFRLIADIGPTKALTVTFLIPLFALLWGALFLHEAVNLNTLIGCALVVLATWLVVFQGRGAQLKSAAR
ncbi:DMT family transporter [Noviherbaspirillum cavernae]|uniref:DMT family transporter n=1 Tax=Noviherbaspirillum cavernae TaxID=2320862 RepID=A0A418WXB6_9BURK|nr:DMT family transporter [Noviherbaspirillum cavernae]RJG04889.1 DMT family transporter [Noviherbaspirillum cavernae]